MRKPARVPRRLQHRAAISAGKKPRPRLHAARVIQQTRVLAALVKARRAYWLHLYRDPEVWTDREKRQAMLRARWDYHEVFVAYLAEVRQADALLSPPS
jgi:hypothetical protein